MQGPPGPCVNIVITLHGFYHGTIILLMLNLYSGSVTRNRVENEYGFI